MAVVIAAIVAGFLAGLVALFREHRQQQRQLLVASRVLAAAFEVAEGGITTALHTDGWGMLNVVPGKTSFVETWDTYKADVAGHLTWQEWRSVEAAATHYLVLLTMDQSDPPSEAHSVLETTVRSLEQGAEALHPYCTKRLSVPGIARRRLRLGT